MESQTPIAAHHGDAQLTPGALLRARYVLEEVIGRGGHSVVYRAKDLHRVSGDDTTGSHIAIKVLHPGQRTNARAIARLAREFRQMQILSHPGIARVFDLDCDGDIWFISMELIAGQTLAQWMRNPVDLTDAVQVIGACSDALDYAHSMGIVHGDLKPSNVLRTEDGRVKLIDFGSVPAASSNRDPEADWTHAATPSYASAQVLEGMRADTSDDIFSLASLSYSILSDGERPFGDRSSLEAHRARLCPAVIPGMPVDIFAALAHSLAGDRERRAATAQEFYRELVGHEPTVPVGVMRARSLVPAGRTAGKRFGRFSLASTLAGIAVVVLCALTLFLPAARKLIAGAGAVARPAQAGVVPAASAQELSSSQLSAPQGAATNEPASQDPAAMPREAAVTQSALPTRHAPGLVTFESRRMVAGSAQSLIAIPLKRLQSTRGAASVAWQIESGSARPDVDYAAVKPQVVRFNEGEAVRSLFIPLIRTSSSSTELHLPRTFSVALREVGGGAKLGPVNRINVTIIPQPMLSDISHQVAVTLYPGN